MMFSSIAALLRKIDPIEHHHCLSRTRAQCPHSCGAGNPIAIYANWGLALECTSRHCKGSPFIVCIKCNDQRKKYTNSKMVLRHHSRYHSTKRTVNKNRSDTCDVEMQHQQGEEHFLTDDDDNTRT